jgi:hypothetical protein
MASAATAVAFGSEVTDESIIAALETGARITELVGPRNSDDGALVLAIVDPDGTVHVGANRAAPSAAQQGARLVGLGPVGATGG